MFLRQFALHAFYGGAEEEGDEMFVSAFAPYLAKSFDIGCPILNIDDKEGMPGMQENPIGEQSSCATMRHW